MQGYTESKKEPEFHSAIHPGISVTLALALSLLFIPQRRGLSSLGSVEHHAFG